MLNKLEQDGVMVRTASGVKTIRACLLCAFFDLVTKAPALRYMKQFNGYYGCSTCTHPGVHSGRCMTYPPIMYPQRTHASLLADAQRAESSKTAVNGVTVLGISILSGSLDIVDDIPVDYMHCVLEGVTKWLLQTWVNSRNHRQPYYMGKNLKQIDELILRQCPPNNLQDHFAA